MSTPASRLFGALSPGGELTSNVYPPASPGDHLQVMTVTSTMGDVAMVPDAHVGSRPFRCVANPIN